MNRPTSNQTVTRTKIQRIALAGNPNVGKTTLFNLLTGLRQKVGNYPGVTVERKVGHMLLPTGESIEIIDLPLYLTSQLMDLGIPVIVALNMMEIPRSSVRH